MLEVYTRSERVFGFEGSVVVGGRGESMELATEKCRRCRRTGIVRRIRAGGGGTDKLTTQQGLRF